MSDQSTQSTGQNDAEVASNGTGQASTSATETPSDAFSRALAQNRAWASSMRETNASLLSSLAKGQKPSILWIGCSDSRVPETTILGMQPGDVFVHRNIANLVTSTDLSSAAVVEYAVNALKVDHIVLCGHTSCGGVGAALGNKHIGLIDAWLMPLRAHRERISTELEGIKEPDQRIKRLVVENVKSGVGVLRSNPNVLKAQLERDLKVHGVVYDISSGELEALDITEAEEDAKRRLECFNVE